MHGLVAISWFFIRWLVLFLGSVAMVYIVGWTANGFNWKETLKLPKNVKEREVAAAIFGTIWLITLTVALLIVIFDYHN